MHFTYRIQRTFEGRIGLDRGPGEVEPPEAEGQYGHAPEEVDDGCISVAMVQLKDTDG